MATEIKTVACWQCQAALPISSEIDTTCSECGFSANSAELVEAESLRIGLPYWQARYNELVTSFNGKANPVHSSPASRHGEPTSENSGYKVLLGIGAFMLFMGIATFTGYNWNSLGRFGQFGVLETVPILAGFLAYRFRESILATSNTLSFLSYISWLIVGGWIANVGGVQYQEYGSLYPVAYATLSTGLAFLISRKIPFWRVFGIISFIPAIGLGLHYLVIHSNTFGFAPYIVASIGIWVSIFTATIIQAETPYRDFLRIISIAMAVSFLPNYQWHLMPYHNVLAISITALLIAPLDYKRADLYVGLSFAFLAFKDPSWFSLTMVVIATAIYLGKVYFGEEKVKLGDLYISPMPGISGIVHSGLVRWHNNIRWRNLFSLNTVHIAFVGWAFFELTNGLAPHILRERYLVEAIFAGTLYLLIFIRDKIDEAYGMSYVAMASATLIAINMLKIDAKWIEAYTIPFALTAALYGYLLFKIHRPDFPINSYTTIMPALLVSLLPSALLARDNGGVRIWPMFAITIILLIFGSFKNLAGVMLPSGIALVMLSVQPLSKLFALIPNYVSLTVIGISLIFLGARRERIREQKNVLEGWAKRLH